MQKTGFTSLWFLALFFFSLPNTPVFGVESVKFELEYAQGLAKPVDIALNSQGDIFVLDAGTAQVHALDAEGKIKFSFGGIGSGPGQFAGPRSLAVSRDSHIAVADTLNNRVQIFNIQGELLFAFGAAGNLPGQFKYLSALATDRAGFVYTADRDLKRAQIFSPNGMFLKSFPLEGQPLDISVDNSGVIYVLLGDVGKVVKFDFDGNKIGEIKSGDAKRDELRLGQNLTVDLWGNLYVTQPSEQRIVKLNARADVRLGFGSEGTARGQFNGISGAVVSEQGMLYICDSDNSRIQVFKLIESAAGGVALFKAQDPVLYLDFEAAIPSGEGLSDIYASAGWGLFFVSDAKNQIWNSKQSDVLFGAQAEGPQQLLKPASVYVTLNGRVYVADAGNHRIVIYNPDGTLNYSFGKNGTKTGQFNSPQGVAVNSRGMIYVADTLNNRVQVFNQDGIFLSVIGVGQSNFSGKEDNCLIMNSPRAIALDSNDNIYVLDADNAKVKVFSEGGQCLRSVAGRGSGPGQFEKPVDIAIDENDFLYVADQASSRVQIFDPDGHYVLSFGAVGVGGGYFKQVTSVSASEGKVYVTDYASSQVQVFRYSVDGLASRADRLNITKTANPPPTSLDNDVQRYHMAKKAALRDAVKELTESFGFSREYLMRFIRIESVETLRDNSVKVTISIPKFIPKEIDKNDEEF